jgi:hypothetical protein
MTLDSARDDVGIAEQSHYPAFLKVSLRPGRPGKTSGKRWELTVAVPPGWAGGALPARSEVLLRTRGKGGRLICIPVRGTSYRAERDRPGASPF